MNFLNCLLLVIGSSTVYGQGCPCGVYLGQCEHECEYCEPFGNVVCHNGMCCDTFGSCIQPSGRCAPKEPYCPVGETCLKGCCCKSGLDRIANPCPCGSYSGLCEEETNNCPNGDICIYGHCCSSPCENPIGPCLTPRYRCPRGQICIENCCCARTPLSEAIERIIKLLLNLLNSIDYHIQDPGCTTEDECLACICGSLSNNGMSGCGTNRGIPPCNNASDCFLGDSGTCFCGPYFITAAYFEDCSTPGGGLPVAYLPIDDWYNCSVNVDCATQCVKNYFQRYGSFCTSKPFEYITCPEFAGIHNGGPMGCDGDDPFDFRGQVAYCCAQN